MARRPHPYFGKLDRLAAASLAVPRGRRGRAPLVSPDEEPGVLPTAESIADEVERFLREHPKD